MKTCTERRVLLPRASGISLARTRVTAELKASFPSAPYYSPNSTYGFLLRFRQKSPMSIVEDRI